MPHSVTLSKLDGRTLLSEDGDIIALETSHGACAADRIQIGLRLDADVTWWKAIKLDDLLVAERDNTNIANFSELSLEVFLSRTLHLWKAKVFGAKTDWFQVTDAHQGMSGGNRYLFAWLVDSSPGQIGIITSSSQRDQTSQTQLVMIGSPPDAFGLSSFVRLDGTGVAVGSKDGGGKCTSIAGRLDDVLNDPWSEWARFNMHSLDDGTTTFESASFPNVYLRMDGRGIHGFQPDGGGVVNGAYSARSYEHYRIHDIGGGLCNIESNYFNNIFLRLQPGRVGTITTGSAVQSRSNGNEYIVERPQETVLVWSGHDPNCQYGAQAWEQFQIVPV